MQIVHINEGKGKLALFSTKDNVLLTPQPSYSSAIDLFCLFDLNCFLFLISLLSFLFPPSKFHYFPPSFLNSLLLHNFIIPPPPPPPHFYCFPSSSSSSTSYSFSFASLLLLPISIVFPPPPPPPPHFYCFPSTTTTTATTFLFSLGAVTRKSSLCPWDPLCIYL